MTSQSRTLVLAILMGLLCACGSDSDSSNNSDRPSGAPAQLTGHVAVQGQPFRLQVVTGDNVLVQQSGPIRLSRLDGSTDELLGLVSERKDGNSTEYSVATQSGKTATVTIAATNDTSFRITVTGPGVAGVVIGLQLEPEEVIYGLTERLRDSAALSQELHGPPIEEFSPDAVSTLNRRGEIVEMFVRPTVALYAPFYHSSRGYGLWIEGSSPGVFDIGASHHDELVMRMETARPQGLSFHIF
ncbi:MAG TPA: hypothetical protein VIV27_04015, partial [Halioglobus sp.]